ncbi:hypothetical protein CR513_27961 [Mucuna pruriens]|uniref:Uncharacterized protein n=1 Tax=Mucuna pruriens TaxID=157652 RepID=A0A371GIQ4_MUCPR|nr:hypothetical protein CR513_27961 [Mucuna pruriens]
MDLKFISASATLRISCSEISLVKKSSGFLMLETKIYERVLTRISRQNIDHADFLYIGSGAKIVDPEIFTVLASERHCSFSPPKV